MHRWNAAATYHTGMGDVCGSVHDLFIGWYARSLLDPLQPGFCLCDVKCISSPCTLPNMKHSFPPTVWFLARFQQHTLAVSDRRQMEQVDFDHILAYLDAQIPPQEAVFGEQWEVLDFGDQSEGGGAPWEPSPRPVNCACANTVPPSAEKKKKPRRRQLRSKVWLYFQSGKGAGHTFCKICGLRYMPSTSTASLVYHLENKHGVLF